jgi:hypothetical protein
LDRVTAPAAAELDPVTPSSSDLWKLVLTDCIQARQEVLGVMAGIDDMPHLTRFPVTHIHVNDALGKLRGALLFLDVAIQEIQAEIPEKGQS